jgi:hypothetical protein
MTAEVSVLRHKAAISVKSTAYASTRMSNSAGRKVNYVTTYNKTSFVANMNIPSNQFANAIRSFGKGLVLLKKKKNGYQIDEFLATTWITRFALPIRSHPRINRSSRPEGCFMLLANAARGRKSGRRLFVRRARRPCSSRSGCHHHLPQLAYTYNKMP